MIRVNGAEHASFLLDSSGLRIAAQTGKHVAVTVGNVPPERIDARTK